MVSLRIWAVAALVVSQALPGRAVDLSVPALHIPTMRRHKVETRTPEAAALLLTNGARLLADYGSYQLFDSTSIPTTLASGSLVEPRNIYDQILLNSGALNTTLPQVQALRTPVAAFSGKRLHLVHFVGSLTPPWREALLATGVQIVSYIPQKAVLVYGEAPSLKRVQELARQPFIQWDGDYLAQYKIHPGAKPLDTTGKPRAIGTELFAIQLVADPVPNQETLVLLARLAPAPFKRRATVLNYVNVIAKLPPEVLQQVAQRPDVVSIQPYFERRKFCEQQDQIIAGNLVGNIPSGPGYLAWLEAKGFTEAQFANSAFVVDVADSGIDNGTTAPYHLGLHQEGILTNSSRVAYARLEGTPNAGSTLAGCDGHGTLNSHIIAGFDDLNGFPFADTSGFHYGLGVCPFATVGSSVIFDPDNFTFPDYNNLLADAYQSGARLSNNSWGGSAGGAYDVDAQNYDALVRDAQPAGSTQPATGNQEMVIVFAAGNDGPTPGSVDSPGTAKNVLTVGAAENVQPIGGADGSGVADSEADNANDIASFSSRGPCADGRHKPDLMAPGTHVSGGVVQIVNPAPDGTADSCFSGSGVSGGAGSIFFPAGQEFYTASSGTSHSTPCVTGGCALLRQFFINHFTNTPSPAMTKAYLLNSARYLNGAYANDSLWSGNQGMGEMNLGMAFDNASRILRDQVPADLFTASGQARLYTGTIIDTNKPFRVTIAWTDAPGNTVGSAYNNDLDLRVTVGGVTYKGNVFSGAYSAPGGLADVADNVESVFLPPGTSGNFIVEIDATDINSDGVPGNTNALDQDFALVVYNGEQRTLPVINGAGMTLLNEGCPPANNSVDPGETVTLNFALQNMGTSSTTNLVATLQADAEILSPSPAQTYGSLPVGGVPENKPFTFTANGACGSSVTARLLLQDGSANLGMIDFTIPLGKPNVVLNEAFDSTPPPDLPLGWTTTPSGAASNWVTTELVFDTAPVSAFAAEPDSPGIAELLSPLFHVTTSSAQLTFRNNFDLEADSFDSTKAYDGGVLEIQVGSSGFFDILDAGGSFITGGYNRTIDPAGDNPLLGRSAWSGASGGFSDTIVTLPSSAAGQDVQLKWRLGTDSGNANGGSGWHIDKISISDGYACCGSTSTVPSIATQPTNQTVLIGATTAFTVGATGSPPLSFQWLFNGMKLAGASTAALNLTNVQATQTGDFSVIVTNLAGSVLSRPAHLKVLVPPTLRNTTGTPTNTTVIFSSLQGLNYTLQTTTNLSLPQWVPVTDPVAGTGGSLILIDTNTPGTTRFYRLLCN